MTLFIANTTLFSQCITEQTGGWASPGGDRYTADMNGVQVTVEAILPVFSGVTGSFTSTMTNANPAWFSESVAGSPSLQLEMIWDIIRESQLEDIDDFNDDKKTGGLIFTFSEPVNCVTIHFERIGGAGVAPDKSVGISNSVQWTIITPGITLQEPAGTGTDDFIVTPTQVYKEFDVPNTSGTGEVSQGVTTGSAAGSVKLVSATPITMAEFEWTGVGVEGTGADQLEIVVTAQPSCFPVAQVEKFVDDVRTLTDGSFEVDYYFEITNEGQSPLKQLSLLDELQTNLGCAFNGIASLPQVTFANASGMSTLPSSNSSFNGIDQTNIFTGTDGELQAGDSITVMITTLVDPNCVGVPSPMTNVATLTGTDIEGTVITASSEVDLLLPRLTLKKTASTNLFSNPVVPGDAISYSFEVCNVGNGVVSNIQVTDPKADVFGSSFSLSPGLCNSNSFTGTYNITTNDLINGEVVNQAMVTGIAEDGSDLSDESDDPTDDTDLDPDMDGDPDDPTVVTLNPVPIISINKVANTSKLQNPPIAGDTILYMFEICNIGSLNLTGVSVDDPIVTIIGNPISLAPGICNTSSFNGLYVITQADLNQGEINNTAVATAQSSLGEPVMDEASVDVILDMAPQIQLIKTADASGLQNPTAVGDVISYSFEVCNVGNVVLTNVIVNDPLAFIPPIPINLLIGQCDQTSFSVDYQITALDVQNGTVTNLATVSAASPSGIIVIDYSDDSRGALPGNDDPTIVTLLSCDLDAGSLNSLQDECISDFETINLTANVLTPPGKPAEFEVLYILTKGSEQRIIATGVSPSFSVSEPDVYTIHTLVAEISDPSSSSYLNPSLIIDNVTLLSDINAIIENNSICADLNEGSSSLVSRQSVLALVNQTTICNSDELLLPTSILFEGLFQNEILEGEWSNDSLGVIQGDSIDFTGFTAGEYIFNFVSTDAIDPCINLSGSTIVNVVDCFNECAELICNEDLQISLGEDCALVPTADQLLETPATGVYTIEYFYENERPYGIDTLRSDAAGELLTYRISCAGNSCWGKIQVETNNIPTINAPCACNENGIPDECILWCQDEEQLARILISTTEAAALYGECGPEIIGNIRSETTMTGELCEEKGETYEIRYTAKIIIHGNIEEIDVLCQSYRVQKFDIDLSASEFNMGFGFPTDVTLDCDYLDALLEQDSTLTYASPESILQETSEDSLAYPYYVNTHSYVQDSFVRLDTQLLELDPILVDTLVFNDDNEWEILTVSRHLYDTIITEKVVPTGLAVHPLIAIQNQLCNLQVGYSDFEFESCGNGNKIARTWTMLDWCDNSIEHSDIQTIDIRDLSPPQFVRKQGDEYVPVSELPEVQVGIDPWACSASLRLPSLTIIDNCDTELETIWSTFEGKIDGNVVTDLWYDQSPVTLTAIALDDCDNLKQINLIVHVVDDVAPVVQTEQELKVVLSYNSGNKNTGDGKIYASDIDEGSHDACGDVIVKVVRADDWRQAIETCEGDFAGYLPVSGAAVTETVDIGNEADKGICLFDSTNLRFLVTEPQDFVRFTCNDIGNDPVEVIFFALDEAGNQNQTTVSIFVEDESVPFLECEDIDFSCEDLIDEDEDEFEYDEPLVLGKACINRFLFPEIASERRIDGACGQATIIVEWFLDLDQSGDPTFGDPMCTQLVEIETEGEVLEPETIKWPPHYTNESYDGINIECDSLGFIIETESKISMPDVYACVPDFTDNEGPVWCDSNCGVVGTSYEIDTLFTDDSCMKLVRKWTVIDWCTWDPNSNAQPDDGNDRFVAVEDWAKDECSDCIEFGPYDSGNVYLRYKKSEELDFGIQYLVDPDGFYTFDQIIKVVDTDAPEISVVDTIIILIDISGVEQDTFGLCFGSGIVSAEASDFCGSSESGSNMEWTVEVQSEDGQLINDLFINDEILGPSAKTGFGQPGEIQRIIWTVRDGCTNVSRDTTIAVFQDQTAPTIVCPTSITSSLSDQTLETTIWASDIPLSSYDNCDLTEELEHSILTTSQNPLSPTDASFAETQSMTFNCSDSGQPRFVDVWVWDAVGNGDYCSIQIFIDSNPACHVEGESALLIGGSILTELNEPIEDAIVSIHSILPEYPKSAISGPNGTYTTNNHPPEFNYELDVSKDDDYVNGLSTLDLLFLQNHILGIEVLGSPYKVIASDANGDAAVSVADILDFRKIILGLEQTLANVPPWSFIPASESFIDIASPWPFINVIEYTPLSQHHMDANFVGVKIGDVNNDVKLSNATRAEIRGRSTISMSMNNQTLHANEPTTVGVYLKDKALHGLQFTLEHSGLELVSVTSNHIDLDETHIGRFEDQFTLSWHSSQGFEIDEPILFIEFISSSTVDIQDKIRISHSITHSEAYIGSDYETFDLALEFSQNLVAQEIELGQNIPNPVLESTIIPFYTPKDGNVEFTLYDVFGRRIFNKTLYVLKGNHQLTLNSSDFIYKGVIMYEMKTGNMKKVGRMSFLR